MAAGGRGEEMQRKTVVWERCWLVCLDHVSLKQIISPWQTLGSANMSESRMSELSSVTSFIVWVCMHVHFFFDHLYFSSNCKQSSDDFFATIRERNAACQPLGVCVCVCGDLCAHKSTTIMWLIDMLEEEVALETQKYKMPHIHCTLTNGDAVHT